MKRELGQYFTTTNPFELKPFTEWLGSFECDKYLEPFAGANNIPLMLNLDFDCYDIEPKENPYKEVIERDTILNMPEGYKCAITNPPYLSRVSASTRHLPYPDTIYPDLYLLCIEKMLEKCDYVAAIIPETFILSGYFRKRLSSVISLTCKMFEDTDCPVCLAMFDPQESEDFKVYRLNDYLGTFKELQKFNLTKTSNWKFNVPDGPIGLICVDNTKEDSIRFCRGEEVKGTIKVSSRAFSRISGYEIDDIDEFINKCNEILAEYREKTNDVFMASFKGLRKDGKYRRRLDFKTANAIMTKARG